MISKIFLLAVIVSISTAYRKFPPPVFCSSHIDCTSYDEMLSLPFRKTFALCDRGRCASLRTAQMCTKDSQCGFHHSCGRNGKCVYGGLGASCSINAIDCAPGFACDATTKKCVRGVTGVVCRSRDSCGFGNFCVFPPGLPPPGSRKSGVCKRGSLGTLGCRRDSHCVGNLRCLAKTISKNINGSFDISTEYRCSRIVNFRRTRFPFGFRRCTTNAQCNKISTDRLTCERGYCQPLALGQTCKFDFVASNRQCDQFTACVNGKCAYAREGDKCYSETGGRNGQCAPGFRCTAPRNVGLGKPGICTKGVAGNICSDGSECSRLICGTSGKCTNSAQGQLCRSDFWCPRGLVCNRNTKKCARPWKVPRSARYPWVQRSIRCRHKIDCPGEDLCKNGICLPRTLGFACTEDAFSNGLICENGMAVEGILGKRCKSSYNCYVGLACVKGNCAWSFKGASCFNDINCIKTQACSQGSFTKCITPKRGDVCRTNIQCPKRMRCLKAFDDRWGIFGRCV